ncbi:MULTISPECIES: thiol reductant ABC exporter subunit CydD [unclassified Halomonas]|uniref:thiol reductant ABC exporter subunit CydD n=1 Tax=unclassified Halomonas TaxID=2609666 RepID=UPI002883D164|nr:MULTISPECIES: thiol reductant ABC exporter subunit CydD [unclassified Halomonas]MDT0499637.1 thiol reductant ABC exporter subunit CydD [Halomonas sp. PAR7]MDT0510546.1 thiol reductant ABC exporter subunit CydD [Halomonas sp. LES1]MDT0592655.1 thiol reductant ABC exporter subunit CydD [Halomonas sp. PAR8]
MGSRHGAAGEASRWLAAYAADERWRLTLAVVAGVVAALATLGQLALLARFISELLMAQAPLARLTPLALGMLALLLVRSLALFLQERLGLVASLALRRRIRGELLDHLARLGPAGLSTRHSASLASQLVEQVEALDGYMARYRPQLALAIFQPLVVLVAVAWLDWLAALFLLLSAPLIPLFMALVGMGAERLNREQFEAVSRLSGHFIDRVRAITTLQLFGRTREATAEVHGAADDYRRRSLRTLRVAFLSSAVLEFFASVAIAVVAIYVGFGLLGYITLGPSPELTLFSGLLVLLLAPEFFQPLRVLSQHYHDRAAALGAADGLMALLAESVEELRGSGGEEAPPAAVSGELIRLEAATVSYPQRGRVLGPLDLVLVPGEVVVVSAPSGGGKSTLLQLLAGFVGPERGRQRMAPGLRYAWMDQRPLLVKGSLADNLRLAAPQADVGAMRRALERAGLGELLARLPRGLDTPLGERGAGLSGGQAQRLALARVFLCDAPLVLLDEPTASLDAATEADIIAALGELALEGRCLVIATHHPALMALADRRLMLDQQGERIR